MTKLTAILVGMSFSVILVAMSLSMTGCAGSKGYEVRSESEAAARPTATAPAAACPSCGTPGCTA